jgi:hypothetical protein
MYPTFMIKEFSRAQLTARPPHAYLLDLGGVLTSLSVARVSSWRRDGIGRPICGICGYPQRAHEQIHSKLA